MARRLVRPKPSVKLLKSILIKHTTKVTPKIANILILNVSTINSSHLLRPVHALINSLISDVIIIFLNNVYKPR